MLYGEYLRKREIFTQYTTGELTDPLSASLSWPASSHEGLVNEELCSGWRWFLMDSAGDFGADLASEPVFDCLSE